MTAFEKHYTVSEIAKLWNLDESTVRRQFQDLPGVLKIGALSARRGKRHYYTLRIPESVVTLFYGIRTR
jgi:hypothetical protein